MKPPCHNCKLKCAEKIDVNYRKAIFAMFWGMGDFQRQREFIKDSAQAVVPKYQRITLNRKRERGSNQSYSITKDGEKILVCKQFFKNTFDLSDRAIRTPFEKTDKSTGVLSLEMRGKHGNDRKLDQDLVKTAKVRIEKIPRKILVITADLKVLGKKDLSRLEKENDKKSTDSTVVAVYDPQAVLSCPQGEASSYYYTSKLAVYNLTIAELKGGKTVNCYIWDETQGKRGVIEIGNCVLKYLQYLNDKANRPIDVVLYSDNCCGQQKNNFMMSMYKNAVTTLKNIKSVTHKFLVNGHTQNEGDSAHSTIEKEVKRALRSGPIYLPSQYAMAMKTAKKSGKPYLVHELSHEDFFDIKALKDSQVILRILDIRMF
ncbi:uncharacterized protein TNCV_1147051 [Trichonephila clavipes]|nr:uncharacterized protein TNCV_1147051 [Trichonephila clavipes]